MVFEAFFEWQENLPYLVFWLFGVDRRVGLGHRR